MLGSGVAGVESKGQGQGMESQSLKGVWHLGGLGVREVQFGAYFWRPGVRLCAPAARAHIAGGTQKWRQYNSGGNTKVDASRSRCLGNVAGLRVSGFRV